MKKIRYHSFFSYFSFFSFFFPPLSRVLPSARFFQLGDEKAGPFFFFFRKVYPARFTGQQWGLWAIMTNIYEFTIWWLYDSRFYHLHAKDDVPFREKMALTGRLSRAYLQPEHLVPSRRPWKKDRKSKSFSI